MTYDLLKRGNELLKEIESAKDVYYMLERTLGRARKPAEPEKKFKLRFTNNKRDTFDGPPHAGIFLFNGISHNGVDIPVDESTVELLRDFFLKTAEDKQREFDNLGGDNEHEHGDDL